ncbi:MAG: ribosomal protein S18-alanine N-acetyltransferase [Myxococcales bacterium]|nr:ribosomal protein S18-alanine N-acetyltransferase [Myxococcota bacterium]MDW8280918.1 ribosomal protein S18-alanine N-acetyltransferase [Myxococcales bacterium]
MSQRSRAENGHASEAISLRLQRVSPRVLHKYLPDLLEIEQLCFPRPWGPEVFEQDLLQEGAFLDVVTTTEGGRGRALAFCSYRQLVEEMHILQIATHPLARRRGLATRLLLHALSSARQRGCVAVLLEVRPSNRPALALYEKHGFQRAAIRRGYYADNGEDALLMRCELGR